MFCMPAPRAYKLGKKRWSYNQCELTVLKEGSILADKDAQKLSVMQTALNSSSSHDSMENKVSLAHARGVHAAAI